MRKILGLICAFGALFLCQSAQAQTATVQSSCGGLSLSTGFPRPLNIDTTGNLCTGGTISTVSTVTTITNPVGVKGADGSTITSTSNPLPTEGSFGQGSTTSGQTGVLGMMATTTSPPTDTNAQTNAIRGDTHGAERVVIQDTNGTVSDFTSATLVAQTQLKPNAATQITATATGTTGATTATLAGTTGKTTYLCGFSIRANATAAATGNATVTGLLGGTINYTQWTAPLASGLGVVEPNIGPLCLPASATNTGISVVSAAPGSGGTVSVTAWGYTQ